MLHFEMIKARNITGLIAGIILILSSAAHTFMGWDAMKSQLAVLPLNSDLFQGLRMAWVFGGMTMLVLGILNVLLFRNRLRGVAVPELPALITGIGYLIFGIWSLIMTNFDAFNITFLLPGILLCFAGSGGLQTRS